MKLYEIISLFSNLVWFILPMFRYKKKYFFFFFILSMTAFSGTTLHYLFSKAPNTIWAPLSYLLVFSLYEKFFRKHILPISIGFFPFIILSNFASHTERYVVVLIIHVFILLWFLWEGIKEILVNNKLDFFLLIMSLYEFLFVFKFVAILVEVLLGMEVFYVATAMQIFIGLYLIFVRKDIVIQLKNDDIKITP